MGARLRGTADTVASARQKLASMLWDIDRAVAAELSIPELDLTAFHPEKHQFDGGESWWYGWRLKRR